MPPSIIFRSWFSVPAVLAFSSLPFTVQSAAIDANWRILPGSDPLEETAARDLAGELKETSGISLPVSPASELPDGPAIIIGTLADNPLIAAEHARAPFDLAGEDPERYHLAARGERLYAVGATPKGAMNAAFRFADRRTLEIAGLDEAKSPAFRHRIAGHLMNQSPPPGWTEEDQARFYARNYINVVWGEKHGPPLSLHARKKYGLGLIAELRFPSGAGEDWRKSMEEAEAWWNDPANSDSAYYSKPGSKRRVVSPFGEAGRRFYLEGHRDLLEKNPDIRIFYSIFGDYNAIPAPDSVRISDGQPYGHTRQETMLEILELAKEAIGGRDIVPRAWMWHGFYGQSAERSAFMRELPKLGFGPMYNEAGDDDCWVIKLDNFDEAALAAGPDGRSLYGPDYLALASIGGACESVTPVIGMPLPRVAAYKLGRLAGAGVRDVALWWGSGEGWIYQPNLRVLSKLAWADDAAKYGKSTDFASAEPLLEQIAREDFGPEIAADVVAYWKKFDEALVTNYPRYKKPAEEVYGDPNTGGLRIYDWYQRMGTYVPWPFGSAFFLPLTPKSLAAMKYGGWGKNPYALTNYAAVLDRLAAAQKDLEAIIATASTPAARRKLEDTRQWTELYRLLLTAQYHHLQGRAAMDKLKGVPIDSAQVRAALEPLVKESIANTKAIIVLAGTFPENLNIGMAHRDVVHKLCTREDAIGKLQAKLIPMEIWLGRRENLAKGRPVQASSFVSSDRKPELAVDGDAETLWSSQPGENGWITVDLGRTHPISSATLVWKTAFAKSFEVQTADDASAPEWKTVYRTDNGKDGPASFVFPENTAGRLVRIRGLERGSPYGYALREIEIYGE